MLVRTVMLDTRMVRSHRLSLVVMPEGMATSNSPNMARPMAAKNTATPPTTQGLCIQAPNMEPMRPAEAPRAV